ncbi:MAG: hypothetical protein LKE40_12170 [Spirochaetia bacterium]|jgi:hypothetical protein|nr:hypothetical protein [Spirochaetia bacterium]
MKDTGHKKPKVIRVTNKKNGVTYLYEDYAFWNKEKKRGEHKRRCIGHIGDDGTVHYNEYYRARRREAVSPSVSKTTLMGQDLILNKMIGNVGIKAVLDKALGADDAAKVLQLAMYSICEGKALSRACDWLDDRGYDGASLGSQRISDLLASLSDDRRNAFFRLWLARQTGKKALLFDITSTSSYAKHNPYVERGYNRDHGKLPQINLGLLTTHSSNIPLWYADLPGSMADSVVLDHVLDSLGKLGVSDINLVGDRGFYSEPTSCISWPRDRSSPFRSLPASDGRKN